ncbi:uncharacterized protein LOC126762630 [Bactrocera neohumeralis]|uniref:uncharacterized protein LOC126762630 n=2 Tax=Bactrocera tyroni species complex TaxID=98808 RepID=UPI002165AB68|nr:uncharacterized protein LOC126762630 [Bactrocera neohumeralis]XP_050335462.1 uncharacterized protein LOC126762630 [Bactrocera neohumeralis]XP_050335463.1 uncharacterized protein LOC126762630 [Bactrocera neohumeralis]
MHLRSNIWESLPASLLLCIVFCDCGAVAARYQGAARQRGVRFNAAHMTFNHAYVHNVSTDLTDGALNIEMWLLRDVVPGFMTKFDVFISLSADKKRFQSIFAYNVDLCGLMNNLSRITLLRAWMLNVIKYSNLKPHCPLEAGHYYIRNFTVEKGSIPVYLQAGEYRIVTHHYYKGKKNKKEIKVADFQADLEID